MEACERAGAVRKLLVFVIVASAGCLLLLGGQVLYSGSGMYLFLGWNLLLATVPFLLALTIEAAVRHELPAPVPLLFVLWVLFLPNAPYLVTDFVHLGTDPSVPIWYDALLFSAFATVGLVLGLMSIRILMRTARHRIGPTAAWAATVAISAASSLGIFLGRFEQLNSWDMLVRPVTVARVALVTGPLAHEAAFTLGFTVFLITAYKALELLALHAAGPSERY